jgi:hypothetical protein
VREPLGCAALDAFLTAGTFSDRILGLSETATLPNRAQFIATGNNLKLTGDTCRRVFLARLDAQSERPYARDFSFDPAQQIESERMRYVVAALTIIRAFITAGRPKLGGGRTASFELWDDLVRQPICWIKTLVAQADDDQLPALDDPLQAAETAFDQDPETTKHKALLQAWYAEFPDIAMTVAGAVARGNDGSDLHAALYEIGGQGAKTNTRIVGRWIERRVGKRINGLRFEHGNMSRGLSTWIVKCAVPTTENKPTIPTTPTTELQRQHVSRAESGGYGGSGGLVPDHGRADLEVI